MMIPDPAAVRAIIDAVVADACRRFRERHAADVLRRRPVLLSTLSSEGRRAAGAAVDAVGEMPLEVAAGIVDLWLPQPHGSESARLARNQAHHAFRSAVRRRDPTAALLVARTCLRRSAEEEIKAEFGRMIENVAHGSRTARADGRGGGDGVRRASRRITPEALTHSGR